MLKQATNLNTQQEPNVFSLLTDTNLLTKITKFPEDLYLQLCVYLFPASDFVLWFEERPS